MISRYSVIPITWNTREGERARNIRIAVFVEEQGVPLDEEIDAVDPEAFHVLAVDADGGAQGTGRLYPDLKEDGCAHIGRMAVLPKARGTGCGAAILNTLILEADRRGFHRLVLASQVHVMDFYAKFGFRPIGMEYMECAIPHHDMERILLERP